MISFEYPLWTLVLCALLAIIFAFALYWKPNYLASNVRKQSVFLAILRFFSVGIIGLLLLGPILKSYQNKTEKPIVVIAVDQSASIGSAYDSSDLSRILEQINGTEELLSQDFEVHTLSFADEIETGLPPEFSGQSTNLSNVLGHISSLFGDQNLAATFIFTDGIYNQGQDPVYISTGIGSKIYPVLMGDTTLYTDFQLERVFNNRIGYLGDKASIEVDVSVTNATNQQSNLRLQALKDGRWTTLDSKILEFDNDAYFQTTQFNVALEQIGLSRYRVIGNSIDQEKNIANNSREFFIDVIDSRRKILLLAQSPHPDIGVFQKIFDQDDRYEISIHYVSDPLVPADDYDLLVFHRLPSLSSNNSPWKGTIENKDKPRLFILGSGVHTRTFNNVQSVLQIQGESLAPNDVQVTGVNGFTSFKLTQDLPQRLENYPPITAPYGDFTLVNTADVLLNQRIGNIETEYPLWMVSSNDGISKLGVIAGEGIWRWQLYDYQQDEQNQELSELLNKTTQFLSLKEDKRPFRVSQRQNIYTETENVVFDAELYNASFERTNSPEPSFKLRNEAGDNFDYTFSKTAEAYNLDIGRLPAGNYTWSASVFYEGNNYQTSGQFGITALNLESQNTLARKSTLNLLAAAYGGEVLSTSQLPEIPEIITSDAVAAKPVIYRILQSRAGIDIRWLFGLLLALLAGEWLWRRLVGAY